MPWVIDGATRQGARKKENEDRILIHNLPNDVHVVGVFDGHAGSAAASDLCKSRLPALIGTPDRSGAEQSLRHACEKLAGETEHMRCGTTLSVALLFPTGQVVTAYLGDSPIVAPVDDTCLQVSDGHNARCNQRDLERALACGAVFDSIYVRVREGGPGLQMTRSLGDCELRSFLSREPAIGTLDLTNGCSLLLATDGVLDRTDTDFDKRLAAVWAAILDGCTAEEINERMYRWSGGDDMSAVVCRYK